MAAAALNPVLISCGKDTYTVTEEVGHGAFGEVFKGTNSRDGRQYALKKLNNRVNKKNVAGEVKALTKVPEHDHVVRFHGHVEHDAHIWLILEFCEHGTLSKHMLTHDCPQTMVIGFAENIASGIKALHKKGIIHRDLKSDNILLALNRNSKLVCKISDFGLAKCLDPDRLQSLYLNSVVGVPFFTAPEVWENKYSYKADIFSLGVILYAMFTRSTLPGAAQQALVPYVLINSMPQPIASAIIFGRAADVHTRIKSQFRFLEKMGILITSCVQGDPGKRPDAEKVHSRLRDIEVGGATSSLEKALTAALRVATSIDALYKPVEFTVDQSTIQLSADSGVGSLQASKPFLIKYDK